MNADVFNNCVQEISGCYETKRTLTENELVERTKYILTKNYMTKGEIHSPTDTKNYLICELGNCENEKFCVIFLDSNNQILAFEVMFTGTINNTIIYPRVLIKKALELNAAAAIVAHNHPSGKLKASNDDHRLTRKLKDILKLVDVRLLDHVIIGRGKALSFAEERII